MPTVQNSGSSCHQIAHRLNSVHEFNVLTMERAGRYGDMAITRYNAISNLLDDCKSGRIDTFAHMGNKTTPHTKSLTP